MNKLQIARELIAAVKELTEDCRDRLVTADEMYEYCPDCADKIRSGEMIIRVSELRQILGSKRSAADKWKKMPKGWTDESRKKFWDSLTSRAPKHKVSQCMKKMEGKIDNPGAFCAALADRVLGTTKWRGKK